MGDNCITRSEHDYLIENSSKYTSTQSRTSLYVYKTFPGFRAKCFGIAYPLNHVTGRIQTATHPGVVAGTVVAKPSRIRILNLRNSQSPPIYPTNRPLRSGVLPPGSVGKLNTTQFSQTEAMPHLVMGSALPRFRNLHISVHLRHPYKLGVDL